MEIVNWVLFLSITVFGSGCVTGSGVGSFPIRRLEKGAHSGVVEPRQVVIKDKADWQRLWREHSSQSQPQQPIPEVDFAKEMAIFVAMGQQFSGGFAIEIEKMERSEGRLKIFVRHMAPGPGAMVSQALSTPFEIVAVPRAELRPEFVEIKDRRRE